MKAITSEKATYPGMYNTSSRLHRPRRDVENEEIRAYLTKLKELVPHMPKNRRLSKLEVIQYVIDYICDLQYALETHPNINSAAVQSAAAVMLCSSSQQSNTDVHIVAPLYRQPLGVLPPNANVAVSPCTSPDSSTVSLTSYSVEIVVVVLKLFSSIFTIRI